MPQNSIILFSFNYLKCKKHSLLGSQTKADGGPYLAYGLCFADQCSKANIFCSVKWRINFITYKFDWGSFVERP